MNKTLLTAALSLLLVFGLTAPTVRAGISNSPPFLDPTLDAGSRALGGGLVGLAEGETALFYNPAAVSDSGEPRFHSLYEPPFDQYSAYSLSFSSSGVGIAYRGLSAGEIIGRDLYGQPTGEVFSYEGGGLIGSAGRDFGDFGLGLAARAFYKSSTDYYFGYSLTPGLSYERAPFRVGLILSDLVVSEVSHFGLGDLSLGKELTLGLGIKTEPLRLGLDVDANLKDGEVGIGLGGAGLEWRMSELFVVRAGVDGELKRSFGFGIQGDNVRLDYAYTLHEELPDSYVVSLGWVFD